jgi:hypothetical protein
MTSPDKIEVKMKPAGRLIRPAGFFSASPYFGVEVTPYR